MDEQIVATNYWKNVSKYPNYPNVLQRRLIDTVFVSQRIFDFKTVLDIGCGDGSMLLSLREFTKIESFYGVDLSALLIGKLKGKWGTNSNLATFVGGIKEFDLISDVDALLSLGSFLYIFDNDEIIYILEKFSTKVLIARAPCTLKDKDEVINKYSDELEANYAAKYRTVDSYKSIFMSHFDKVDVSRAYPDKIESKYGTKHFFFDCKMQRH